ncbi:MAG: toxin-antitoxin system YwqK family antitoxin [Flavobacteriales bacterium]
MTVKLTNGQNIISYGLNELGIYLCIKKPAAIVWGDCKGSVAQYACLMPIAPEEREKVRSAIVGKLEEDFSDREVELADVLNPLLCLFDNGEYEITFDNGEVSPEITIYSGGGSSREHQQNWELIFGKSVDSKRWIEVQLEFKEYKKSNALQNWTPDILDFTTNNFYNWEDQVFIATRPETELEPSRIAYYVAKIQKGERPFAILTAAQSNQNHEEYFVLDGHHKLRAYEQLKIRPPFALITRIFNDNQTSDFDLELLAESLYPCHMDHILTYWTKDREEIQRILSNPLSKLLGAFKHGDCQTFHANGQLKLNGNYIYDIPHGIITEFYSNGRPMSERNYDNGSPKGTWKTWFDNKILSSQYHFDENGRMHGEALYCHPNGKIREQKFYDHGKFADLTTQKIWNDKGILIYEYYFAGDNSFMNYYDDNGFLTSRSEYSVEEKKMKEVQRNRSPYQAPEKKNFFKNLSLENWLRIGVAIFFIILFISKC